MVTSAPTSPGSALPATGATFSRSSSSPAPSFARGFEPFIIATENGRVETGIINRETIDAIVLVTPGRAEINIPRRSIELMEPGRVSVMPRGLEANLSQKELADLVAFLQAQR